MILRRRVADRAREPVGFSSQALHSQWPVDYNGQFGYCKNKEVFAFHKGVKESPIFLHKSIGLAAAESAERDR
jgi:hypothetical protein